MEKLPFYSKVVITERAMIFTGGSWNQEPNARPIKNVWEFRFNSGNLFELPNMKFPHSSHTSIYVESIQSVLVISGIS